MGYKDNSESFVLCEDSKFYLNHMGYKATSMLLISKLLDVVLSEPYGI
jgi:hypothetical protein